MSYRELQPLPADIAPLLDAERRAPRPPASRQAAILARVEAAVGAAPLSVPDGGVSSSAAATAKGLGAALPLSKTLLMVAALAAGGSGAAIGYRTFRASARPAAIVDTPDVPGAGVPAPAPPRPPLLAPLATAPAATDAAARAAMADLAAESALLEHARQALARGAPQSALEFVKRHARLYAGGHLIEEREALWIKALAASDQERAARARAASFERRFPRSIQREPIDRALRKIP